MLDLRSHLRRRLLAFYFTNPTAKLHVRELAQRLGLDPSNLSKELRRLERDGLFQSDIIGRQKHFQLNHDYPLFDEIRGIVLKTVGVIPTIAATLKELDGIQQAWLYGSFARGEQDAASDIDLLIIGSPAHAALAQTVSRLEKQLGRQIGYTVLTMAEFEQRRARKDPFLENVWRNQRIELRSRE